MDARNGQRPAAIQRLERRQHEIADGREKYCGVERLPAVRSAAPCADAAPNASASSWAFAIAGHHVDLGALRARHLRGEVGAPAEAVDPQPSARRQLGTQQRAIADDARAQSSGASSVSEYPAGRRCA